MTTPLYVGIDAGSSATKCVILNEQSQLVSHQVASSGFNYQTSAHHVLTNALNNIDADMNRVKNCISTGYGKEHVDIASKHVTEITCHARGARQWYPEVRNIIDIGGQDTKVICLNSIGQMIDYRMNAKCAAGTGTFLESISLRLGIPLSEIDTLAMQSVQPATINSYCTVFAGTEVIERIKAGDPAKDIAMGLFQSIAKRIMEMLPSTCGPVAATGGVVAHCKAMIRAIEEVTKTPVFLPPLPQFAGAFGAALIAMNAEFTNIIPQNTLIPQKGCEKC